jgi:hypothetical protein
MLWRLSAGGGLVPTFGNLPSADNRPGLQCRFRWLCSASNSNGCAMGIMSVPSMYKADMVDNMELFLRLVTESTTRRDRQGHVGDLASRPSTDDI